MKKSENPFVAIAMSMAGILIPLLAIAVIFLDGAVVVPVVVALVAGVTVLGSVLGYFAFKKK